MLLIKEVFKESGAKELLNEAIEKLDNFEINE